MPMSTHTCDETNSYPGANSCARCLNSLRCIQQALGLANNITKYHDAIGQCFPSVCQVRQCQQTREGTLRMKDDSVHAWSLVMSSGRFEANQVNKSSVHKRQQSPTILRCGCLTYWTLHCLDLLESSGSHFRCAKDPHCFAPKLLTKTRRQVQT